MPGTPAGAASAQPVRVEYVPKSKRKAQGGGAPAPKPAPPRVEPMPDALASEFADFDDGPAKVVDTVVGEVVEASVGSGGAAREGKKGKKSRGSRKRKKN